MKTYKKIIAEGLVLAGLLGMFGCHSKGNRSASLEYKIENAALYDKISKTEEYLKMQGFHLMKEDRTKLYNAGEIWYVKDYTLVVITVNLKGSDNTKVDIWINTSDENFEPNDLEREICKMMIGKQNETKEDEKQY